MRELAAYVRQLGLLISVAGTDRRRILVDAERLRSPTSIQRERIVGVWRMTAAGVDPRTADRGSHEHLFILGGTRRQGGSAGQSADVHKDILASADYLRAHGMIWQMTAVYRSARGAGAVGPTL